MRFCELKNNLASRWFSFVFCDAEATDRKDRTHEVVVKVYDAFDLDEDDLEHFKNEVRCMQLVTTLPAVSPRFSEPFLSGMPVQVTGGPHIITLHDAYKTDEVMRFLCLVLCGSPKP